MNKILDIISDISDVNIGQFIQNASHLEIVTDDLIGSNGGSITRLEAGFVDGNGVEFHLELNITDGGKQNEK